MLNFQLSYVQSYDSITVSESSINENQSNVVAWKCYRCDLILRDESHVLIHKDISKHSMRQIKLISS